MVTLIIICMHHMKSLIQLIFKADQSIIIEPVNMNKSAPNADTRHTILFINESYLFVSKFYLLKSKIIYFKTQNSLYFYRKGGSASSKSTSFELIINCMEVQQFDFYIHCGKELNDFPTITTYFWMHSFYYDWTFSWILLAFYCIFTLHCIINVCFFRIFSYVLSANS